MFVVAVIGDFKVLLENIDELVIMLFSDVLDNAVINAVRKADRAPSVRPKNRFVFTFL